MVNKGLSLSQYLGRIFLALMKLFVTAMAYIGAAAITILLLYGGYLMIESFFKWLGKNHKWFELTDKKIATLEKELNREKSYSFDLSRKLEKQESSINVILEEIKKLRAITELEDMEKVKTAAKKIENETDAYHF